MYTHPCADSINCDLKTSYDLCMSHRFLACWIGKGNAAAASLPCDTRRSSGYISAWPIVAERQEEFLILNAPQLESCLQYQLMPLGSNLSDWTLEGCLFSFVGCLISSCFGHKRQCSLIENSMELFLLW